MCLPCCFLLSFCQASALTGQLSCASCVPGTFSNQTGLDVCFPCVPGSSQANEATTSCALCTPGTFQSDYAQPECVSCAAGSATNVNGSTQCTSCGAGSYAPSTGYVTCLPCDLGEATEQTGQSACSPCAAGQYTYMPQLALRVGALRALPSCGLPVRVWSVCSLCHFFRLFWQCDGSADLLPLCRWLRAGFQRRRELHAMLSRHCRLLPWVGDVHVVRARHLRQCQRSAAVSAMPAR